MKRLGLGIIMGSLLTASVSLAIDSKMWRFGSDASPSDKLDQIQRQHQELLDHQDRLERLLLQSCGEHAPVR